MFSAAHSLPEISGDARPSFTIASANINLNNSDVRPFADWLAGVSPDVVAVLEVSPEYAAGLAELSNFPHQVVAPASDPFGIALLSKHPLTDARVVEDFGGTPHIEARVAVRGQEIRVVAFHPMPPISVEDHRERNEKLKQLVANANLPSVIAGDFNATPWSTAFAAIDESGWRRATGLAPTWPSWGKGVLGIPIDHVLASQHFKLISSELGPDIGSDHLPVTAQLLLDK